MNDKCLKIGEISQFMREEKEDMDEEYGEEEESPNEEGERQKGVRMFATRNNKLGDLHK